MTAQSMGEAMDIGAPSNALPTFEVSPTPCGATARKPHGRLVLTGSACRDTPLGRPAYGP
ncbi:hypothetical protein GCM10010170_014950 [Dactylosporangium salmoneum]|uniref:Uncharacterized protein n=1 Tax=Dactylosporangium salmoneum TaxID=53361 RepID=A0ABN3FQF3_9ACTN